MGRTDLIDIYILYIRSVVEYRAVVWHSSQTQELKGSLEMVQKTCLRVILGDDYPGYAAGLDICGLESLFQRREDRCLTFATRCLKHPTLRKLFPLNLNNLGNKHKSRELYEVNFARTGTYKNSAIPYLQRRLNGE